MTFAWFGEVDDSVVGDLVERWGRRAVLSRLMWYVVVRPLEDRAEAVSEVDVLWHVRNKIIAKPHSK